MKKFFSAIFLLFILISGQNSFAQLSGTVTVGAGGAYTNFTGATGLFNAINTLGLSGDLTVAVVGNSTEDGTTALNAISSGFGVYIIPAFASTFTISGTGITTNAMIRFNGVRKVYVEGSFLGSGQYLVFQNYNSTPASTTPVFEFTNEARAIAIRNCYIRSNASVSTNASIRLGTTSGILGNDSLYISKNIFEGIGAERYFSAFYNNNALAFPQSNSLIAITSNTFRKWRGTSTAIVDCGSLGDSIAVDSNYFYNDTAQTVGLNIINYVSTNSKYNSVSYNSIGGSAFDRSGSPLLNVNGTTLQAIRVSTSTAGLTTIRGNTISNIAGNDAVATCIINGIVAIGRVDIYNNTLGGGANPWDTLHTTYDNGLITVSGGTTDTVNVYNNTISKVRYYRKKNDRTCGILVTAGLVVNVYNNTVTDFRGNPGGTSTSFQVYPIRTANNTASNKTYINDNVINNIVQFTDTTIANSFAGILYAGGNATGFTYIYNNKVYDLTSTNTNTGATAMIITGIQIASATGNVFVYNNAISLQTQTGTEAMVRGIWTSIANAFTVNHSYLYNSVYIGGSMTGASNYSYGFFRSSTGPISLRNNIFYYNRTGGGGGFPVCIQSATNWQDTMSNNNLFIGLSSGNIGAYTTTNTGLDFATWKTNSLGDKSSLAEVVANVSTASLWNNTATADMTLLPANSSAWYAYGQGTPVNYPSISGSINAVTRSTTIVGGPTTIGCAEQSLPTAVPPTVTNTITGTGTYNYSFGGKLIAAITINAPTGGFNFDISLRHFGGRIPPGFSGQYSAGYDSIYVSSGTPTGLNYDINLYSYPNQQYNITTAANTRIAKSSNQGTVWDAQLANGSYTAGPPAYATATGLTSFSIFTLTSTDAPMPVELSSFTSLVNKNTVELNWTTVSEENNRGFEIERKSFENGTWAKVGYAAGNGTVNYSVSYKFTEKIEGKGKYNYRLKQIDNNGNYKYYDLASFVEVGVPNKFALSQNYPNPFNPTTKIDFDLPFESKVTISIYDMTGREVMTLLNGDLKASGYYTMNINASALSSGTYFYTMKAEGGNNNFVQTKKMMLVK
ncbi:MAG: T9SS type A sorting domain-containing protein [Ignavibacteria bacterium]|nr:T9SS type A sorting domain-containing protein [Ignavibacteria bacterium]